MDIPRCAPAAPRAPFAPSLRLPYRHPGRGGARWFVVARTEAQPLSPALVERELRYALGWAAKAPANESPWTFMRGHMRLRPGEGAEGVAEGAAAGAVSLARNGGGWKFREQPWLKGAVLALRDKEAGARSVPLLGLLLEMLEDEALSAGSPAAVSTLPPPPPPPQTAADGAAGSAAGPAVGPAAAAYAEAAEVCKQLLVLDAVRKPYWWEALAVATAAATCH